MEIPSRSLLRSLLMVAIIFLSVTMPSLLAAQPVGSGGTSTAPFVCGPNVSKQITDALSKTRATFASWPLAEKSAACKGLVSYKTATYAWDIIELHNQGWILTYRPACASVGAKPVCGTTVQVGSQCYYAGSPNYVLFGVMFKLCYDHFNAIGEPRTAPDFSEPEMLDWINLYKGSGITGLGTPVGNYIPSRDWAVAGYRGWPVASAPAPAGDRSHCAASCPIDFSGSPLRINWVWKDGTSKVF